MAQKWEFQATRRRECQRPGMIRNLRAILHNGIDPQDLPRSQFQSHRRDYQIIFQDPLASLDPRMTIGRSIADMAEGTFHLKVRKRAAV